MRRVQERKGNGTFSIPDMLVSPFLNFHFHLCCLLAFFSWIWQYLATKSDPSYPCRLQQLMFIEFILLGRYHSKQFMYVNSSTPQQWPWSRTHFHTLQMKNLRHSHDKIPAQNYTATGTSPWMSIISLITSHSYRNPKAPN